MNRYAKQQLACDFDSYDRWGWVMGHWFAIAELLHAEGEDVPDHWEFRASPLHERGRGVLPPGSDTDYPDAMWAELWLGGYIDADELRKVGNILTRYAHLCVRAGLDY